MRYALARNGARAVIARSCVTCDFEYDQDDEYLKSSTELIRLGVYNSVLESGTKNFGRTLGHMGLQ